MLFQNNRKYNCESIAFRWRFDKTFYFHLAVISSKGTPRYSVIKDFGYAFIPFIISAISILLNKITIDFYAQQRTEDVRSSLITKKKNSPKMRQTSHRIVESNKIWEWNRKCSCMHARILYTMSLYLFE